MKLLCSKLFPASRGVTMLCAAYCDSGAGRAASKKKRTEGVCAQVLGFGRWFSLNRKLATGTSEVKPAWVEFLGEHPNSPIDRVEAPAK